MRNVQPITRQALESLGEGVVTVDGTVALAQKASDALATILTNADQSLEMTHAISGSLQDQSKASQHLHQVIIEMSDSIASMRRRGRPRRHGCWLMEAERVHDIAQQVKHATQEQTQAEDGIARAMESIAGDVGTIRDRLGNQLHETKQIAANSVDSLTIAHRNHGIAEQFGVALRELLRQGDELPPR